MGKEIRNSNIEVYRILAAFLVMLSHFNGWFVGGLHTINSNPTSYEIGQSVIASLTCICVNMFLVISGWFGLKFRFKSILHIYMILVGIYVPLYLVNCFVNDHFSILHFVGSFLAFSKKGWYIQCYIGLMILSGPLNSFIEHNKSTLIKYVITLWAFEFWFDCIRDDQPVGLMHGYSIFHFVVMYMIGRVTYIYQEKIIAYNRKVWLGIYLMCTLIIYLLYRFNISWALNYSNPFVMVSAYTLFFVFIYKRSDNKLINIIGASTLSVFIIHCTEPVISFLKRIDNFILNTNRYPEYLLYIFLTILIVFVLSIIYDKIRSLIMNPIEMRINNRWASLKKYF